MLTVTSPPPRPPSWNAPISCRPASTVPAATSVPGCGGVAGAKIALHRFAMPWRAFKP